MHLVAMPSKLNKISIPMFLVLCGSGSIMRCVFRDVEYAVFIANTMKSFEDRSELLTGWIGQESDPGRVNGVTNELRRYVNDRALLKQYIENDTVTDNGERYTVQMEAVPVNAACNENVVRRIIRLPEFFFTLDPY